MPRRDGTGPNGMGSMTGGRVGFCDSGFNDCNFGRCFGGNGFQRGCRRQFVQTGIPGYLRNSNPQNIQDTDEKAFLEMQETKLENQLKSVKERLSNLNNDAK